MRNPEPLEETANSLLIQKGAIPVDFNGIPLEGFQPVKIQNAKQAANEYASNAFVKIIELLKTGEYSAKDILKKLQMDWTEKKLRDFLRSQIEVETINKKPLRFKLKNQIVVQKSLFD